VTPSVSSKGSHDATETDKGLASGSQSSCTTGCTSEAKPDHADPLASLAATLRGLSPEDRARLAAILLTKQDAQGDAGK
jgi:hypothetical protein